MGCPVRGEACRESVQSGLTPLRRPLFSAWSFDLTVAASVVGHYSVAVSSIPIAVLNPAADGSAMTLVALGSFCGTLSSDGWVRRRTISNCSEPSPGRAPGALEEVGAKIRRWYQSLEPGASGGSFLRRCEILRQVIVMVLVAFCLEVTRMPRSCKPAVKKLWILSVSQAHSSFGAQTTEIA